MAVPGRKASSFRSIARGSDELHVLFCEPCNSDGHHLQADGYCVDCREYLCSTCIQYHGKVTATKKHVLLDKTNMPQNKLSTSTADICTEPCPNHKSKIIEYYCKTHDQLGCSVCMTVNHRNCEDVDFILDIVDGIEDSPEYDDLVRKCTVLELDVEKNRNIAKSNTSLVKAYVDEAFKHIREVRHEMNALFQELENQICEGVSVIRNEDSAVIRSVYEECDAVRSEIKDMTSDLDDKRRAKLGYHIFLAINKANTNIKSLQSKVNGIEKRNVIRQYSFEPAKPVIDMKQNLVELGKVLIVSPQDAATATGGKGPDIGSDVGSEAVSNKERKTAPPVAAEITQQKEYPKARKATFTNGIKVKSETDSEVPTIVGMVLLPDDRLVTADTANGSIKLIDLKHMRITSELKLTHIPCDITMVNKKQLAVTVYAGKIQFVSLTDTLSNAHSISVKRLCRGIVHKNGKLFVTFTEPSRLEIMEIDGTVLKTFTTDSKGNELFVQPRYLTINEQDNMIYVSDFKSNTVVSLAMDGQIKHTYSTELLTGATGLSMDKYGFLYVCNFGHKVINVLKPDCGRFDVFLAKSDLLEYPFSITYCAIKDRMYVGMENCDTIKVYQMQ